MKYLLFVIILLFAGCSTVVPECEGLEDNSACIGELAEERHDYSLCDSINVEEVLKETQISACKSGVASSNLDLEGCERAGILKNRCIRNTANELSDANACESIDNDIMLQGECVSSIAQKTGNIQLCQKAGTWKGTCITLFAEKEENAELCKTIELQKDRDTCRYSMAKKLQDAELCEMIEEVDTNENIRHLKDNCFSDLGKSLSDETLCLKGELLPIVDGCLMRVAEDKQDASICELLVRRNINDCLKLIDEN